MKETADERQKSPFDIPYRLKTEEDLDEASRRNFLDLGQTYREIELLMRSGARIVEPHALRCARPDISKDFYHVNEREIREYNVDFHEIENLGTIDDFDLIEQRIPRVIDIIRHDNLFSYLAGTSNPLRERCRSQHRLTLPTAYEVILELRRLLRSEILRTIRTKRTRSLTEDQLRELITASTLFVPSNEDVLQGLRSASSRDEPGPLFQNALAETLFVRIPRYMVGLISPDPPLLREKLLMKTYKLGLSPRQRLTICSCLPGDVPGEELTGRLERIENLCRRLLLEPDVLARLLHFVDSQKRLVVSVGNLYQNLFLNGTLAGMRKLYEPQKVMTSNVTSWTTVMRKFTLVTSISFYPRKDWLEFAKSMVSSDCSSSDLGRHHLFTPHFFNIRVFTHQKWIGNIYCLDFTEKYNCIIIDRIQIPRNIKAKFIRFFDGLREVLPVIFADVDYTQILVPQVISNHATIQKTFNSYRQRLPKARVRLRTEYTPLFESLHHPRRFRILCERKAERRDYEAVS